MNNLNLLWDITNECNLRCIHCYNANAPAKHSSGFDMIEPKEIIKQLSNLGFTHIHLLGGEPLLYKKLPVLINTAIKNNIDIYNHNVLEEITNKIINKSAPNRRPDG